MPTPSDMHALFEKIGAIDATVHQTKHSVNNLAGKVDALALVVAVQGEIRSDVAHLQEGQKEHHMRLATLEAHQLRREGAIGLFEWVSKHWPFTLFAIVLAAIVAWANGKMG